MARRASERVRADLGALQTTWIARIVALSAPEIDARLSSGAWGLVAVGREPRVGPRADRLAGIDPDEAGADDRSAILTGREGTVIRTGILAGAEASLLARLLALLLALLLCLLVFLFLAVLLLLTRLLARLGFRLLMADE